MARNVVAREWGQSMNFSFIPMNEVYANEIAFSWNYEDVYSFYNMTSDEDDLKEFLNPLNWDGRIFAVLIENRDLIGYFQYDLEDYTVVIGLGLKPEFTGKGIGKEFVTAGLDFLQKSLYSNVKKVRLTVACFNERAIRLYKSLGFKETNTYEVLTNGSTHDFLEMERELL